MNIKETCPFEPMGFRLLVHTKQIEETSSGGIVIATKKELDREQHGCPQGTIVKMGPTAFKNVDAGTCEVGDVVLFDRYAGSIPHVNGWDDGSWRIIEDEEVLATWPK